MGSSHSAVGMPQQEGAGSVSVIMPALNEEEGIGRAITSVFQGGLIKGDEVLVVDGGSTDKTISIAKAHGAKVMVSRRGRGVQMNAGASRATGHILLFLHADSQLPPRYRQHLAEALDSKQRQAGVWGCFRSINLDRPGLGAQVVRVSVAMRTRFMHLPYGDQAIFVRADAFRGMGGYAEAPLMEDVELVRKLKHRYGRPAIVQQEVVVSARRWEKLGYIRTTLMNWGTMSAYTLGCRPEMLARWYYR